MSLKTDPSATKQAHPTISPEIVRSLVTSALPLMPVPVMQPAIKMSISTWVKPFHSLDRDVTAHPH